MISPPPHTVLDSAQPLFASLLYYHLLSSGSYLSLPTQTPSRSTPSSCPRLLLIDILIDTSSQVSPSYTRASSFIAGQPRTRAGLQRTCLFHPTWYPHGTLRSLRERLCIGFERSCTYCALGLCSYLATSKSNEQPQARLENLREKDGINRVDVQT